MAEHMEMTKTTPKEFIAALLGGLAAPLLAIFLIALLVIGIQSEQVDADTPEALDHAVRARIQPFGTFVAIDPNAPRIERTGEQVYNEVCANCHASGALGSPKFGDAAAWSKRLAQGYAVLLDHSIKGIRQMPARGGEPDLTDLEVARGMVHMANAVGARFEASLPKEPEPTAAELARGKVVYAENCASCHDTGITGAQKLDDTAAWSALLKGGKAPLYEAAIHGSFGGPAKGGNPNLSDADTRLAVDYMVDVARAHIAKTAVAAK